MNTPQWAMDLVIALREWEDSGHPLTADSQLPEIKAACHAEWMKIIPEDVRDAADAIRDYNHGAAPHTLYLVLDRRGKHAWKVFDMTDHWGDAQESARNIGGALIALPVQVLMNPEERDS